MGVVLTLLYLFTESFYLTYFFTFLLLCFFQDWIYVFTFVTWFSFSFLAP